MALKDDTQIQKKLFELLFQNPGLHLSKIAETLNLKFSEVAYHLEELERQGKIYASKQSEIVRYYIQKQQLKTREERSLETRRRIRSVISQNPGLHLSKIAELVEMSVPLTDYHLYHMEKAAEIFAVKDKQGYLKRYYVPGSGIDNVEKRILGLLGKKISLRIVLLLLKYSHLQHKDLMRLLKMSSSKLSYHLSILVENQLVISISHGENKGYELANKEQIIAILKKHQYHIVLDVVAEEFNDVWNDLNYKNLNK
jgi:predicted transcriptional regulator